MPGSFWGTLGATSVSLPACQCVMGLAGNSGGWGENVCSWSQPQDAHGFEERDACSFLLQVCRCSLSTYYVPGLHAQAQMSSGSLPSQGGEDEERV